jgi:hypothetical protein
MAIDRTDRQINWTTDQPFETQTFPFRSQGGKFCPDILAEPGPLIAVAS